MEEHSLDRIRGTGAVSRQVLLTRIWGRCIVRISAMQTCCLFCWRLPSS